MASPPSNPTPPTTSPPQQPPTKPFRFKKNPPRSSSHRDRSASPASETHSSSHRHHHHRHHHHRSRRRPRTPPDDPNLYSDHYLPNAHSSQHLDPDTAFRESLFDALADDEGAAFWEGVYGQPIHTYSPYTPKPDSGSEDEDGNRKLERMTDEEYVAYVRGKMWEKSHGYIIEERRRREEERRRRKDREWEEEKDGRRWRDGVDEALTRGEERRRKGRWRGVWERYAKGWDALRFEDVGGERVRLRDKIAWPVESGSWKDVGKENVERFFGQAPQASGTGVDLADLLKKERVRWHPDKMQQRAGNGGIDEGTMKLVTAVFQVIDRLRSETKAKA